MTTELNNDCSAFSVQSTLLEDFVNTISPDYTLTLYVSPTCSTDEIPIEITLALMNGQDSLILTPELLGVDVFSAGVYLFRLEQVFNSGATSIERSCDYVGCPIECDVISYISSNLSSNLYQLHYLLQYADDCSDCNCEGMCAIFEYIQTVLNDFDGCECA